MLAALFSDRTSDGAGDDFTHAAHWAPEGNVAPGGRFVKCCGPAAGEPASGIKSGNNMMHAYMNVRRRLISLLQRGFYGAFPGHRRQEARSQAFPPGSP